MPASRQCASIRLSRLASASTGGAQRIPPSPSTLGASKASTGGAAEPYLAGLGASLDDGSGDRFGNTGIDGLGIDVPGHENGVGASRCQVRNLLGLGIPLAAERVR